jgi:rfaE bifunctional protein nucleotidyltransferase chain/domain
MNQELSDLCTKLESLRQEGKRIVFTNGCFDILHAGHTTYLDSASYLGDVLVVGLNSDDSIRRLKGETRPINTSADRKTVLEALRSVGYVIVFDEDTPLELIKAIQPDVLVKGGDYTPETIVGADVVKKRGGEVVIIPLLEGRSTTSIIDKIHHT